MIVEHVDIVSHRGCWADCQWHTATKTIKTRG